MAMRDDPPIRTGGPNDPVAQTIRREQQRDAMPSASEVKAEHARRLSKEGCQVCGEDDASRLQEVRIPLAFCDDGQVPDRPFDPVVFCDEHARPPSVLHRARLVQRARNADADVLALYACGAYQFASEDREDAAKAQQGPYALAMPPSIQVDVYHHGRPCGAMLEEVVPID